jgi:hypothetical protein
VSVWKRALKTNKALWVAIALVLFVAFGFWNPSPDTKGGSTYWTFWTGYLHSEHRADMIRQLVIWTGWLAIPAVAIGWVLQALIVAVIRLPRHKGKSGPLSRATGHA